MSKPILITDEIFLGLSIKPVLHLTLSNRLSICTISFLYLNFENQQSAR